MAIDSLSDRPTIQEIHTLYWKQDISVTDVVNYFLSKIRDTDSVYNSLLRITEESALFEAAKLDKILQDYKSKSDYIINSTEVSNEATPKIKLKTENPSWFDNLLSDYPLFGIPFVSKDNILVENQKSTSASLILENFTAPYSSEVYLRMSDAGAILVGQTNMDEFAFGSSTEKSAFQITHNPADVERVPGGTSGGSAAAVAAGFVPVALGSDTGGSIRQPSSFCGTVGMRPTYGTVPRFGVMASTSSFDQVGPITNSVFDNALVLSILSGKADTDQTSITNPNLTISNLEQEEGFNQFKQYRLLQILFDLIEGFLNSHGFDTDLDDIALNYGYLAESAQKKITIGFPAEYFAEGLSPETRAKFADLYSKLSEKYEVKEVSLPLTKYTLSVYYILQTVEAAANMERYDGVRFGKQSDSIDKELFFSERGEYLGDEAKRRIMLGTYTSSAGYYDAYYNKACQVRELIRQDFLKAFEEVDVLITAVSPFPAFKIGSKNDDPMAMYLADIMTVTQPPSRLPALSVPIGNVNFEGSNLPVGAQLIGPEMSELTLYKLASQIEKIDFN
ncbi:MAG: Asp-tRNA(Asn)/Glu-tRNA(Gln) amidotransferase subunit GatA [Patescibacteria group bacterium]